MEKKKLLLVAVSVGVFLTIVISASILIFNPKSGGTVVSVPKPIPAGTAGGSVRVEAPLRTQPATVDAAEMVRNADSIQGLQPPPASPAPIQEPNFYIGGGTVQPDAAPAQAEKPRESPDTLVISVPKPSAAAVPASSAAPKPAAGSPSPASRPAAAPAKPAIAKPAPAAPKPAPVAAQKPAAPANPAPAPASSGKKPAPASGSVAAAKPRVQHDYWVQTGAFSAKIRAEGAKETLADKGIASIIDNREVDGKTWYRVRVGPYTSETEAKYWLALVQSIDGFDGSQVRSDPR